MPNLTGHPLPTPTDSAARDRVRRDGLDETLFVEAGAGSGKTTQLVARVAGLVERGTPLREIVIITFTEAATAELRSRVRALLGDEAEVDDAVIATVHGFAFRLLSEFSVAAGLPPQVEVLDEVSSQLAHEQRWERFVDAVHQNPDYYSLLRRADLLNIALVPSYRGQSSFREVAANFNQNWDRVEAVAEEPLAPLDPVRFDPFDRAVAALQAMMVHNVKPDDRLAVHLRDTILPVAEWLVSLEDPDRKLRELRRHLKSWTRGQGGAKAGWSNPGSVAEVKDAISAVADAANAVVGQASAAVLERLVQLTAREVVAAARARRHAGRLEFHDLLVLARAMLRTHPEVRRRLHERYRTILLDEFQDTDPIQIEVASLIAATPTAATPTAAAGTATSTAARPTHWSELSVEPGRLFFVGDPKQSIYRFRRADIDLFLQARDTYGDPGTGGGLVQLTTNYRTVAPIIEWVNAFFADAMTQPAYEPLVAYRGADSDTEHRPTILGGVHPDPKVRAGVLRQAEAADVAATIEDIRTRPGHWAVHDRDRGWRPAELTDITILIPTRTSLPFLRQALDAADIPYRLATGTLVYDTQEVRDALATLRAIDDPDDSLSLVAALRSPLFGCSDVELFEYATAGGKVWDLRYPAAEGLGADHRVVQSLDYLRRLWEDRYWLTPATMLARVLRERHAFVLGFGDPRPTEVWRRLRFLLDQARLFEETNGGDLRAYLAWSELQGADGARVHEPLLPETDHDAVQILTVHGAKGLEFPITIVSGLTTERAGRFGLSVFYGHHGEPPQVKLNANTATAEFESRADLEAGMDDAERLRLLYVAVTRACDHLVISAHRKATTKPTATFAARIGTFAQEHPHLSVSLEERLGARQVHFPGGDLGGEDVAGTDLVGVVPGSAGRPTTDLIGAEPIVGGPPGERSAWLAERKAMLEAASGTRVWSATAIAQQVDEAAVDDGEREQVHVDEERSPVGDGAAVGRAVHGVLETVALDGSDLEDLVATHCAAEMIPERVHLVAGLVRSALASEAVALARSHPHHREVYVSATVGEARVEGYIDLLIEGPDGLIVVDYKTDAEAHLNRYAPQLAAYALALRETTGLKVAECRIVFCRHQPRQERRPPGPDERVIVDLEAEISRVQLLLQVPR